MFTLYQIAFAPLRNSYWIKLLFTHKNGDFGAMLRGAHLESGASHFGEVLSLTLVQCEQVATLLLSSAKALELSSKRTSCDY